MNFQQLKPDMCDCFIFIGVWVDIIKYWVLTSEEARENRYLSRQHRGGIEYQIGIKHDNRDDFDEYAVSSDKLVDVILYKTRPTR
jgi:polyphosphate kinase 2 (PPK2 family)